jgi:hypothetical protein
VQQHQQYVGIDLHRRRSVIVRRNDAGETFETVRIDNDPVVLAAELIKAVEHPEVILEATYGWYWAADVIKECGGTVHLARPLGNNWGHRPVKNDERDATDLVDLLRMGRLAEAWIAPPPQRELRELVRYRSKLVNLRSNLIAQVHAVLAEEGVNVPMSDLFGVVGQLLLDKVQLADAYRIRVESLRDLIDISTARSPWSKSRSPPFSPGIWASAPSRRSPASARYSPPSSWPRSAISKGSRAPDTCAAGPDSPRRTKSTMKGAARAHHQAGFSPGALGGRQAVVRQRGDTPLWRHHHQVGESRGPESGAWRPANFSSSFTTGCVTERSAA